jgi:hypothetical protein
MWKKERRSKEFIIKIQAEETKVKRNKIKQTYTKKKQRQKKMTDEKRPFPSCSLNVKQL